MTYKTENVASTGKCTTKVSDSPQLGHNSGNDLEWGEQQCCLCLKGLSYFHPHFSAILQQRTYQLSNDFFVAYFPDQAL